MGGLDLRSVLDLPVEGLAPGFPPDASTTVGEVGRRGWTFGDLTPPIVLLRQSALDHNVRRMASYCADRGVDLAPHGKTSMSPQLWAKQLDAGAWGITAATPQQVHAMRRVGVPRVLLANELVDAEAIRWMARELADPAWIVACWVDSVAGVQLLARDLGDARAPRALPVLVELGHANGRTGCRSVAEGLEVAAAVMGVPELRLVGVAGYEGTIGSSRDAECLAMVDRFVADLRLLAERLLDGGAFAGHGEIWLSAGGSIFFDRVIDGLAGGWPSSPSVRTILRAGCTLTHDHGLYERLSPFRDERDTELRFRPAFEAWGSVLSRPEPDVLVVGLGKRDIPADIDPPRPLGSSRGPRGAIDDLAGRIEVIRLMDQHAICRIDAALDLVPGDLVRFGISHPCTAFDRRRVIPVLDDDDRVVDAVATVF